MTDGEKEDSDIIVKDCEPQVAIQFGMYKDEEYKTNRKILPYLRLEIVGGNYVNLVQLSLKITELVKSEYKNISLENIEGESK